MDHSLMGERHGTAEVPKVAASLYERLADHGYGPVTLGIGPYVGQATTEALQQDGYPAFKDLITRYESPAIPFLNRKEEAKMAARMAEAGAPIWGIDYEFIFSLPMHLDALAEEAETERERKAVRHARKQMTDEWGGATGRALAIAPPSALQTLRAAFKRRGDQKALDRIDALRTSNAIYPPYVRDTGSFFESRIRRETLMKEQLIEHIRKWEDKRGEAPNVFYKSSTKTPTPSNTRWRTSTLHSETSWPNGHERAVRRPFT